ncbi:MAG: glycoside hydrolase family 127 protein [Fusicatenibacter sp.]|nr:glycoside hydrolase family 127 protein [Lachnospiraceae bacterium]MDY2938098.1 glycoside hydrolase family 127 protein [Fusicatenibacter sp.]
MKEKRNYAANAPRRKTDCFYVNEHNRMKYHGFVDRAFEYIEKIQLLNPDLWKRFVQQFKEDADFEGGWRGEYWGKMMRGACFVYSYTQDSGLYEELEKTILDMLSAQAENGRISSYGVNHEFEAWDLWGRKYVLLGMQYFLEICTDQKLSERIVESMCRQVDYIMDSVGNPETGKMLITKATHNWRGLNSASILEPIVRLYSISGEKKYLDFAEYIVETGGTDIVNIFDLAYEDKLYPYQYPVTKAYEMTSCFEGALEYYRVTGNEKYKRCVINYADKILESDFTIIGCCGCTHELFDHSTVRQANTTNDVIMQETCVTVTIMKFMWQLTLLTGEAKYADAFERSFYNAYLGSINTEQVVEPAMKKEHPGWCIEPMPFDSYSPLTAGTRGNKIGGLKLMSDNHYYGCCACIGSLGLGLIPKMAVLSTKCGFVMNLYIDGECHTSTVDGRKITFRTVTDYPVSGNIKIQMDMQEEMSFELLLRIPLWSKQSSVKVREEQYHAAEGYFRLYQVWQPGDEIRLELDMRTEVLYPVSYGSQVLMNQVVWGADYIVPTYDEEDPIAKHHIALRRGPIILAQENRLGYSVDTPVEIRVENGYTDAQIPDKKIAPYENLIEVEIPLKDGEKMHLTDYASAGKLWTQESKMAAWILVK